VRSALAALAWVCWLAVPGCSDLDPTVGPRIVATESPDVPSDAAVGSEDAAEGVSFRRDIRPMLERKSTDPSIGKGCKNCHDSREANHVGIDFGGFDCATLGALREGGGSTGRRIIVPGRPEDSALIQKLTGKYPIGVRMPKNGPPFWSDSDIALVSKWIAEGAKGQDDE
jgi:hypothetical protein